MLKNYLKTAWRTLVKNKLFSFINIFSVTIGLCTGMLVFTFVKDELSYDRFWKRADDIYRVLYQQKMGEGNLMLSSSSPLGLGPELRNRFPELEDFAQATPSELNLKLTANNAEGIKIKTLRGDTSLPRIFDFTLVAGSLQLVGEQNNLIITESLKNSVFKDKDPVGLTVYNMPTWESKATPYHIIAVVKDIPSNTHLRAAAIELERPRREALNKEGGGTYTQVYFLLKPKTNVAVFQEKINKWYAAFIDNHSRTGNSILLQPLKDIYLHSDFDAALETKGSYRNVYIIACVGILVLIIGCINFVNLTTARLFKRYKETGIRKILGAERKQVLYGFLIEAGLFFSFSALLALVLFFLLLPALESFIGHPLQATLFSDPFFLLPFLITIILLSFFTGIYPAWVLSGFKPADNLRGRISGLFSAAPARVRQVLVFIQFVIAISVLTALIIASRQMHYINTKDIGYQKDNLLYIGLHSWEGKAPVLKNELLKINGVQQVSFAGWYPETGSTTMSSTIDNPLKKEEKIKISQIVADFDFIKTLDLQLQSGRELSAAYGTDAYNQDSIMRMNKEDYMAYIKSHAVMVTAGTAKQLNIRHMNEPIPGFGFVPVGVLKDFYRESLFQPLSPTVIFADNQIDYSNLFIRVSPGRGKELVRQIHSAWQKVYPSRLFDVQWVNDVLAKQYTVQYKQQTLFMLFSIVMLCVAAMGVFGLIVHATQQREKEIGIRKVLGASVTGIVQLLTKNMLLLVVLALLTAIPLSGWAMQEWLQVFAYRINIQWWMFALAGFIAVLVALLAISIQAVKAASINPVQSLRSE